MKFAATIWILYNFQIQKRIVSAETIWGNTVYTKAIKNLQKAIGITKKTKKFQ